MDFDCDDGFEDQQFPRLSSLYNNLRRLEIDDFHIFEYLSFGLSRVIIRIKRNDADAKSFGICDIVFPEYDPDKVCRCLVNIFGYNTEFEAFAMWGCVLNVRVLCYGRCVGLKDD